MLKNKNLRRKHKHIKILENVPRLRVFCYHLHGDPITESIPQEGKGAVNSKQSRNEGNYPGDRHDRVIGPTLCELNGETANKLTPNISSQFIGCTVTF